MKKYKPLLFALPLLAALTAAPAYVAALAGQDPIHEHGAKKAPAQAAMDRPALEESAVRKMVESGKPSAQNNILVLAGLSGEWHYTAAIWAKPGAEPKWTKGTIRNQMTLDDRFLSSTYIGSLDIGGHDLTINGQGLIGFDNARKSFTSVWADTLTTGMMIGTGTYDRKKNVIKETGQFTNPLTGTAEKFRSELQFTDTDDYKRIIFAIDGSGKETKLMEFDYSKRG
jgi:hypothetical protein